MSVIVILILASLVVALVFLAGFIWAVRSGQYDDTTTPSLRVLTEEPAPLRQPGALPSEGRGGATSDADSRASQAPFSPRRHLPHLQSESNQS